jgi:hypothetical protein
LEKGVTPNPNRWQPVRLKKGNRIPLMKRSEALLAHRDELRHFVRRHGLSRPRVFGSVLNGNGTDESDLDLLVEPAGATIAPGIAG